MSSRLNPFYAFTPQSQANESIKFRLYIQYKAADVSFMQNGPRLLKHSDFILMRVHKVPVKISIHPGSQPVKEVLKDLGTEKVFNIVIEGGTRDELQRLSKLYASLESWNDTSYTGTRFNFGQYYQKTFKQVINTRGRGNVDTLVLGFAFPIFAHTRVLTFSGNPKTSTKYTLHVKFKKYYLCNCTEPGKYRFSGAPISCTIIETDKAPSYNHSNWYQGSTVEFFFKGNDLVLLQNIKSKYLQTGSHNEEFRLLNYILVDKSNCFETVRQSSEADKYIVSFENCADRVNFYLCYGR